MKVEELIAELGRFDGSLEATVGVENVVGCRAVRDCFDGMHVEIKTT